MFIRRRLKMTKVVWPAPSRLNREISRIKMKVSSHMCVFESLISSKVAEKYFNI